MTSVEKCINILIIILAILCVISTVWIVKTVSIEMETKGLKGIVEEVWHGKDK